MGRSLAILGVPNVLGGGPNVLDITAFTQTFGAELVTNGNFAAWTGDNPDGWSVVGESGADPMVTETAADGSAGNGSARFYNSATAGGLPRLEQNALTANQWFYTSFEITSLTSGGITNIGTSSAWLVIFTTATRCAVLGRANAATWRLQANPPPDNLVIDNATVKQITLNTQQVLPSADALIDFTFALPASPAANDTISVFYRISDADLETGVTCWRAYIQRNLANTQWDFRLDSINAGTATNRINVTNVGDAVGIRVQCVGSLHDCWTTVNGTDWTKRGAQINVSLNNTSTGVNTIYCLGTTPTRLYATVAGG